jgi:hypothetical protein
MGVIWSGVLQRDFLSCHGPFDLDSQGHGIDLECPEMVDVMPSNQLGSLVVFA